jgi:tripartite-type tricarboxylate transporter receptor subunit TctC
VRIVVGYTAGGTADLVSRFVAKDFPEKFNQQVVVDKPAEPPAGSSPMSMSRIRRPTATRCCSQIRRSPICRDVCKSSASIRKKDFVPVALVATTQNLLVVHPSFPAKSVKELITIAKASPGKLNYASAGIGGSTHLATELFKRMAGVEITNIPYKGNSPVDHRSDFRSGRADDRADTGVAPPVTGNQAQGARNYWCPALADSAQRADSSRIGVPGLCGGSWYGYVVPAKTQPR